MTRLRILGSAIASGLLGAFLLFGSALAQVPGGVVIKPPFVNGDCVKSAGAGAISTTGSPCSGGSGTVTSVDASGGTTGLTFSGGPITTSGTLTLAGGLVVSNGGTGALTFTANGVIYGNTTSALGVTAAGTTGQYFKGNTGSAPTWGTLASDTVTTLSFGSTGLTPNSATAGAITVAGTLGYANGGTSNTSYTDGQLLIGNTATGGLSKATLTQGANVTITNGNGTITIAASGAGSTGCVTVGTATSVLTDNGLGGCTSNSAFVYSAGTTTLGTAGSVVGKVALLNATSGTLTLAPPTGALGTVTVTVPAATDTLVNLTGSQTLTNKTLTSPALGGTVTGNNTIPLAILAQAATNTVLGNFTSGTANITAQNVVTCSTSASALKWTTDTGFGCNTSINAATLGGATFAAPGAIGGGTPGTGAFTTLTGTSSATFGVNGGTGGTVVIKGATSGSVTLAVPAAAGSNTLTLPAGTTDFSGTGGTSQVVKQVTTGAAFTVARLACADLSDSASGCSTAASGISWGGAPKTTSFTATANTRYCIDTLTTGALTMTLPTTPADGTQVGFIDCKSNFATANLTVTPGGSDKVMGTAASMIVANNNAAATLVYSSTLTDWRAY